MRQNFSCRPGVPIVNVCFDLLWSGSDDPKTSLQNMNVSILSIDKEIELDSRK